MTPECTLHPDGIAPDYVRTQAGQVIHRGSCRVLDRVKYAHEWRWAEGKTPGQIKAELATYGLTYDWCQLCFEPQP